MKPAVQLLLLTGLFAFTHEVTHASALVKDSLIVPVATEMQEALKTYQTNRDIYTLFIARYGPDAPVMHALRQQFRADDSVMLIKMLSIVNTYGWQSKAYFGEAAPMVLIITFMHASMLNRKKYFSLMEDAVKKGNLPPEGFAIIADQIALYDSGQQIYGTQFQPFRRTRSYTEPYPIVTREELDTRRK